VALFENIGVIIRQLFAGTDIADGFDPDPPAVYHRVTVGIARVIDEASVVAPYRCIYHDIVIDGEQIRMMPLAESIRVPLVRL